MLNTIELAYVNYANIPGTFGSNVAFTPSNYEFYTRSSDGTLTEIPATSLVLPTMRGSENNPHLASNNADTFYGEVNRELWVSYENSNAGVNIRLVNPDPAGIYEPRAARVSGGWAEGDTLIEVENLIGSDHADTLTGNRFSNTFEGGRGDDTLAGASTYVFNAGDGTDRIDDSTGNIRFGQDKSDDYAGATYAFAYFDGNVRLTVVNNGVTLNTIDFSQYPSLFLFSAYDGNRYQGFNVDLPTRQNSQGSPALSADSIDNSDTYIFEAGDGKEIIQGEGDGLGNKLIFRAPSGETYADADFQSNRGFLGDDLVLSEANDGSDLEIVVSLEGVETNRVIVQGYFSTGDDEAYTIYRNALSEDTIVSDILAETS